MAVKRKPATQRQKMINLMYVVLMAMLAINVSSDVLEGFTLVEDSLYLTTVNTNKDNEFLYNKLRWQNHLNPAKTKEWYEKSNLLKKQCDSFYLYVESLKEEIVRKADGRKGDVRKIINKEDLEAAAQVMLNPSNGKGEELKNAMDKFRNGMVYLLDDEEKRRNLEAIFSTKVPDYLVIPKSWEEYMFENIPASAAVTLLTKLQLDIRHAENSILNDLIAKVDQKDVKVNNLKAFVIPESKTIIKGNTFKAQIVMAAIDTTQVPEVHLTNGGILHNNGFYETTCTSTGDFNLSGYLVTVDGNGKSVKRNFSLPYQVIEPAATVSMDLMNTMYAGYNNPISVSVPGIPLSNVTISCRGGSISQQSSGHYIVKPSRVGENVILTVNSNHTGKPQKMGQFEYKVRQLPKPTAYLTILNDKGMANRYKGGIIQKSSLLACKKVDAAIDDGLLDVSFRVLSFETVLFDNMGNAVPMTSNGASFSERQKETFAKMQRNKRFYITNVRAIGPDGIEHKLPSSMEVIVR